MFEEIVPVAKLFLFITIVIFPFSHAAFMPHKIGGISGASPTNFIWLITFVLLGFAWINKGFNKIPTTKFFTIPIILFFTLYLIAFLRSFLDISSIVPYVKSNAPSHSWFVLNKLLKPIQFVLTGWIIAKYCAASKNVTAVKNALFMLPCFILPVALAYYFAGDSLPGYTVNDPAYYSGRDMISSSIGMHANGLGGLAVILLGFILSCRDAHWKKIRYISLACCLGVVVISLSRMAFVTTLVLFLLEFRYMKRKEKVVIATISAILIISTSALLLNRIQYGLDSSAGVSGSSVNQLSAGRVEYIWKPSAAQFMKNPVLGEGLFSIWKGPANKRMALPNHPHNAYFEILLDMGILGLIALTGFLFSLWNKSKKSRGLRLALLAWMCMALTGNSFYPFFHNMIIWVIYGLACGEVALARLQAMGNKKKICLNR